MPRIYLDNNATTPVAPSVREAMLPFLGEMFGNPSSAHMAGQQARAAVEEARRRCAALVRADPGDVVFTSGGTEADNLAVQGAAFALRERGCHLVASSIEHPAVGQAMDHLATLGFEITRLPVGASGVVDPADLRKALRLDTVLVSVMHVNNETGAVQPVAELGAMCREARAVFHVDAVQSAAKLPVDVDAIHADLLSVSGHKICGPKGVGFLYVRPGTPLAPLFFGGSQEKARRPGTENTAAVAGLGEACRIGLENLARFAPSAGAVRDAFEARVRELVPDSAVNASAALRAPHVSNISFPGTEGDAVVISLDLRGVAASAGSACASGAHAASPVLKAMGLPPELLRGAVRFSFSPDNTVEEALRAAEILKQVVGELRKAMAW